MNMRIKNSKIGVTIPNQTVRFQNFFRFKNLKEIERIKVNLPINLQ